MKLQQLSSLKIGDKIKLQLIQPQIKCGGRDNVTCHYKGKIIEVLDGSLHIEFKYNKKLIIGVYDIFSMSFIQPILKDIKII